MAKIKPIWEGCAEDWPSYGDFGNYYLIIQAFLKLDPKYWIKLEERDGQYFLNCNDVAQKRETCQ